MNDVDEVILSIVAYFCREVDDGDGGKREETSYSYGMFTPLLTAKSYVPLCLRNDFSINLRTADLLTL